MSGTEGQILHDITCMQNIKLFKLRESEYSKQLEVREYKILVKEEKITFMEEQVL
jgi:hypothetical protein